MKNLLKIDTFVQFVIKTNNYCNLHCEHCTNMCHVSLKENNENIFRRHKWELTPDNLELFCERFKGYGESETHLLTGAETTFMKIEKVKEFMDVLIKYNRKKIKIRTNGYNILGLGEKYLNKFNEVILDNHGINSDHILLCRREIKKISNVCISIDMVDKHVTLNESMKDKIRKGRNCHLWIADIALHGKTLHPCCNTGNIDIWNNDTKIDDELRSCGWTTDNPDLIETVKNWRTTIPPYVVEQCLNNCWWPDLWNAQTSNITLKKNDVIAK